MSHFFEHRLLHFSLSENRQFDSTRKTSAEANFTRDNTMASLHQLRNKIHNQARTKQQEEEMQPVYSLSLEELTAQFRNITVSIKNLRLTREDLIFADVLREMVRILEAYINNCDEWKVGRVTRRFTPQDDKRLNDWMNMITPQLDELNEYIEARRKREGREQHQPRDQEQPETF